METFAFSGLSKLQTLLLTNANHYWDSLEIDSEINLPFTNTLHELDIAGCIKCYEENNYLADFVTRIFSLKSLTMSLCSGKSLDKKFSNLKNLHNITILITDMIFKKNFPNDMFLPLNGTIKEINIHTDQRLWSYGKIAPITTGNTTFKFLPSLEVRMIL